MEREIPPSLVELLEVPGLGPRRAMLIYRNLGTKNLAELEEAARAHKLQKVPGIAEKTEEKILRELERLRQRMRRLRLGVALPAAEEMVELLKDHPSVQRIDPAGSIRRMKETIGDIDLLAASDQPVAVMDALTSLPIVKEVLVKGVTKTSVLTRNSLQIDMRVVPPESYGAALQYFTGSKEHNVRLREIAESKGMKLNEYGLFDLRTGRKLAGETEEEIYHLLGFRQVPPPEMRENRGEIELGLKGELPVVVELADIKGDLHVHTDWSDGVASLSDMIEAAIEKGYEYLAVCDHSRGLGIARGLSVEQLREQHRLIDQLNEKYAPFRILAGIEVNIRSDGSLDYGDEVLRELHIVTASIHSAFDQPREKMTERTIRAIRHRYVDVLNHPTGRIIGEREPYDIDLNAVLDAAAETGTAVEINSSPGRLDLDDVWAMRAKGLGVLLAINTDAHSPGGLDTIRYGVAVARRAWLQKQDVLNTLPLDELMARLARFHKVVR